MIALENFDLETKSSIVQAIEIDLSRVLPARPCEKITVMNRRDLLHSLFYGFASAVLLNKIDVAGAASGNRKSRAIGLQLYTVRRHLERNFDATLRQVADLGIKEVEFAG